MMRKHILGALLAAAAVIPATAAVAQESDRQAVRAARQQQRAERQEQRQEVRQARPQGDATIATRTQFRQRPEVSRGAEAPARDAQRQFAPRAPQANVDANRQAFRQERREDRRDFAAERTRDRQAVQAGAVPRAAFRQDRQQDRQAFQRDRQQDRRAFQRDDRRDGVRGGNRIEQRRWAGNAVDRRDTWNDRDRYDDRRGWNRGWRGDDRYDWNGYRSANRGAFRLPRYYAPYGWNNGYRSFSVGARLSSLLFAQDYWIDDPWSYRLPEAYGPYRWVRYYNDALLVDLETGEVVDVIQGIFW